MLIRFWPSAFLLWAVVVILAYYRNHKPIGWPQAQAIAYLFVVVTAWLGTISLAHGLGRLFIDEGRLERTRTRFALRIGLGLGLIGFGVLLLGALGLYYAGVVWVALLIGQFFSLPVFLREARRALPGFPQSTLDRFFMVVAGLLVGLAFLRALTPPTAYDSLVYHLTGPKLYIDTQSLHHNIDLPYLGFPQAGEMLFLWGMLLIGPETAKLLHLSLMLLSLLLIWEHARRLSPGRSPFAMAFMLATPSALLLSAWAYVDWIPMFSGLAAFSAVEMFRTPEGGKNADAGDSMHSTRQECLRPGAFAVGYGPEGNPALRR
jgi:hypothetical protein